MSPARHVFILRVLFWMSKQTDVHRSTQASPTESRIEQKKNLFEVRTKSAVAADVDDIDRRKFEGPANALVIYKPSLVFSINLVGYTDVALHFFYQQISGIENKGMTLALVYGGPYM